MNTGRGEKGKFMDTVWCIYVFNEMSGSDHRGNSTDCVYEKRREACRLE